MTSGIRDVGGPLPWQAELRSIANVPLLYTPGTESSYSDANYDLLGELIEQRTGQSYGTFIQDQILRPLGMSETQDWAGRRRPLTRRSDTKLPDMGSGRKTRYRRIGDVRLRRISFDGPGHGHLYDGTSERSYPRSGDL